MSGEFERLMAILYNPDLSGQECADPELTILMLDSAHKADMADLEAQIARYKEDKKDRDELAHRIVHEPCESEMHCSCVPLLRSKVKELESQLPKVVKLEAQLLKVVKPVHIKGLNLVNSDNEQIVIDEHYECPECGAKLNWTVARGELIDKLEAENMKYWANENRHGVYPTKDTEDEELSDVICEDDEGCPNKNESVYLEIKLDWEDNDEL